MSVFGAAWAVSGRTPSNASNSIRANHAPDDAWLRRVGAGCDEVIMAWRSLDSVALMVPRDSPP